MNPRKQAYEVIFKVLKKGAFSDSLLQKMKSRVKSDDTEFVYNLVKGTIKMHGNLDYIISSFTPKAKFAKTDIKIKALLYMAFYQLVYMDKVPEHAALFENVELAKAEFGQKVADFVNAVMRNYLRNPEIEYPSESYKRIATEHSYPEKLIKNWVDIFGEENTEYLCMYFNENPKLHIRVNTLETNAKKLQKYFGNMGVNITASNASNNLFTSEQAKELLNDVAFEEGYFSVQDISAALVAELVKPQHDESILDLFAAPGGKTTYMAEMMQNTGEIIAVDKFPKKIKLLKQALRRLQITNVNAIAGDAFNYGPKAPAFDKVLLDAPCSGWGVFQKKADLRWQNNQDIPQLLKIQANALSYGADFVKPGGYLIYSTCTMNPAENEMQIEKFLNANKHFSLVKAYDYIPKEYTEGHFLKTCPNQHHMDGAFAAKMLKL